MPFQLVEPDSDVYAEYAGRFGPYNESVSGLRTETFSLIRRNGDRIVAGGRGHVYLQTLEVRGLWVDGEFRGPGIGSQLLQAIEAEASRRGAQKAMLYSYSWQAEEFYHRHGYETYAKFDFPTGHYRIDMKKDL